MDPEQIQKKAERLKSELQVEKIKKNLKKKAKSYITIQAESRYIFNKIYPYTWNVFIWIFVVFTLGVVLISVYFINYRDTEWVLYVGLILIAAFLGRLIIFQIVKFFRYGTYKDWKKHLNFEVQGWNNLGTRDDFPKARHWDTNVSLGIHLNENESLEGKKMYIRHYILW